MPRKVFTTLKVMATQCRDYLGIAVAITSTRCVIAAFLALIFTDGVMRMAAKRRAAEADPFSANY